MQCGWCLFREGCGELKRHLEARDRGEGRRVAVLLLGGIETGRGDLNGDREEL